MEKPGCSVKPPPNWPTAARMRRSCSHVTTTLPPPMPTWGKSALLTGSETSRTGPNGWPAGFVATLTTFFPSRFSDHAAATLPCWSRASRMKPPYWLVVSTVGGPKLPPGGRTTTSPRRSWPSASVRRCAATVVPSGVTTMSLNRTVELEWRSSGGSQLGPGGAAWAPGAATRAAAATAPATAAPARLGKMAKSIPP